MLLDISAIQLDLGEKNIFKQLALDGVREVESTEIIKTYIEPGEVILELGANVGYFALLEAKLMQGQGKIYAVEPEPHNLALLQQNVDLNDYQGLIETFHLAISDRVGTTTLYLSPNSNTHSLIKPKFESEQVEVTTMTVDEFLKGKRAVSFVRMDIEGYECTVFNGMVQTLNSAELNELFIELHPHRVGADAIIELLKKLQTAGFEIDWVISEDKALRRVMGVTQRRRTTIDEFVSDQQLLSERLGFQVFFRRG